MLTFHEPATGTGGQYRQFRLVQSASLTTFMLGLRRHFSRFALPYEV